MFGFSKKKPQKPTLDPAKPLRFEAYGNSLCMEGVLWPPVIRDDSPHDQTELFRCIADGLNSVGKYNFIVKKLREEAAGYESGARSAVDVKDTVIKIVKVLDLNP